MKFKRLEIPDLILCEPVVHGDNRGYFAETFREDKLEAWLAYKISFCQENESKSRRGVLRGLHYQLPPHAQTKLVRVISGTVLDVALDIREGSLTFGQHVAVELSAENRRQLLIPKGFAHGFVVLSKEATVAYKVDNYYAPDYDRGIAYNDVTLAIDWQFKKSALELSVKDSRHPLFKEAAYFQHSDYPYR
jgi:dTDP-4-dehydrorhamnose 3,5-epimerase